nr:hypothetical protein [uncultured Gellertiella sp.]
MQISLPMLLGILFIALKLTNVIAWSWLWVLAPFWLGAVAVVLIYAVVFLLSAYRYR